MDAPKIKRLTLTKLDPAAYNPRMIDDKAFEGLRQSLTTLGVLEMPVVNTSDGKQRIVSGHQRVKGLIEEGYVYADCIVVEFDEATEKAANLAMNNEAIRGRWDAAKAIPQLDKIVARMPDPSAMGMAALHKHVKVYGSRDPKQMEVNKKNGKKKSDAVSKEGETYELGMHTLVCGDVTNPTVVSAVLGDRRFAACVTDPPFGVEYKRDGETVDLENDELTDEAWGAFIRRACEVILRATNGPCYVFSSSRELSVFNDVWLESEGVLHRWLAWIKTNPVVFVTRQVDFHPQFEWILYGCHKEVTSEMPIPETPRTNALVFAKPAHNKLHPTQKPLDLVKALVEDAADEGDTVFDPFAGSGTTLMACQEAGRACTAVEIEPAYCDVIRKRWAEAQYGKDADWISLTAAV
jgi:DNA modification methylase